MTPAAEVQAQLLTAFPDAQPCPERGAGPAVGVGLEHYLAVIRFLRFDAAPPMDVLVDLTCVDRSTMPAPAAADGRFELVCRLRASRGERLCLRVALPAAAPEIPSCAALWPGADWLEREVREMFGVSFQDHAAAAPLLLAPGFEHWPLRRDYPATGLGEREEALLLAAVPAPGPAAAAAAADPVAVDEDRYQITVGPGQGWDDGGMCLQLELRGDRVVRMWPDPGWRHTGFEKACEQHPYAQLPTLAQRLSAASGSGCGLAATLALETMLELDVPPRARHARLLVAELARTSAHLGTLARCGRAAGARALASHLDVQRARVDELTTWMTGSPRGQDFVCVGGVRRDLPAETAAHLTPLTAELRAAAAHFRRHFLDSRVLAARTRGLGTVQGADVRRWGLSGPLARSAGATADVRDSDPYCGYDEFGWEPVSGSDGDTRERALVRLAEVESSASYVDRVASSLAAGPWLVQDVSVLPPAALPPADLGTMAHHFAHYVPGQGVRPPAGASAYVATEGPEGELGVLVVSDGTDRPCRVHVRTPAVAHCRYLAAMRPDCALDDAGLLLAGLNLVAAEVDR